MKITSTTRTTRIRTTTTKIIRMKQVITVWRTNSNVLRLWFPFSAAAAAACCCFCCCCFYCFCLCSRLGDESGDNADNDDSCPSPLAGRCNDRVCCAAVLLLLLLLRLLLQLLCLENFARLVGVRLPHHLIFAASAALRSGAAELDGGSCERVHFVECIDGERLQMSAALRMATITNENEFHNLRLPIPADAHRWNGG